jgi:type VI secretion system protein VasD
MNMATTAGKTRFTLLMLAMVTTLSGCGLTQKVSDGTVAVTKSIFYKQVKTLHLDITARDAINNNASGAPLSTVVRIYQLKDRKVFDDTDYPSLFTEDSQVIKADLLEQKDIRVLPGAAVTIDVPMNEKAQFVAVAGMFLSPDITNNTWRIVLSRNDLDPEKARQIELNNQGMKLLPLKDK